MAAAVYTSDIQNELYNTLLNWKCGYEKYSKKQITEHTMSWGEYSEWIYKYKIKSMCSEPYCYYIKTGAFIADEMRGQVLGIYRERLGIGANNWSSMWIMDKYDWRAMDRDNDLDPEREYWIINTEELECCEEAIEPDEAITITYHCARCCGDVPKLSHGYCDTCHSELAEEFMDDLDAMPEDLDDYLCSRLELEAERLADIRRGK